MEDMKGCKGHGDIETPDPLWGATCSPKQREGGREDGQLAPYGAAANAATHSGARSLMRYVHILHVFIMKLSVVLLIRTSLVFSNERENDSLAFLTVPSL